MLETKWQSQSDSSRRGTSPVPSEGARQTGHNGSVLARVPQAGNITETLFPSRKLDLQTESPQGVWGRLSRSGLSTQLLSCAVRLSEHTDGLFPPDQLLKQSDLFFKSTATKGLPFLFCLTHKVETEGKGCCKFVN